MAREEAVVHSRCVMAVRTPDALVIEAIVRVCMTIYQPCAELLALRNRVDEPQQWKRTGGVFRIPAIAREIVVVVLRGPLSAWPRSRRGW